MLYKVLSLYHEEENALFFFDSLSMRALREYRTHQVVVIEY